MTDDDDEKTPPRQSTPRSYQLTESQRDERRRALQQHNRTWVRGVPVVRPDPAEEVTAPLELLLNGQLASEDYAQIEALRRSADDVYVLLMNLAKAMSRHRDKDRSGSAEVQRQVIAAIDESQHQLADIAKRLDDLDGKRGRLLSLEGDSKFARRVAQAVLGFLFLSIFGFAWWLWQRAESAGMDKQRLEYVIETVKELRASRWPQASKDNTP